MNIESLRIYCLSLKGVTEHFPFDDVTLVFKVGDKMFCLANIEGDLSINLKNAPEKNIELRAKYEGIQPGYHMNKKHWITVDIDGSVPKETVHQLIQESYQLVIQGLTKKKRKQLNL